MEKPNSENADITNFTKITTKQKWAIRSSFKDYISAEVTGGYLEYCTMKSKGAEVKRSIMVVFYEELFKRFPEMSEHFPRFNLRHVLDAILAQLDNFDDHTSNIKNVGERHYGYGVREHHFKLVSVCLLDCFQEAFPTKFTNDIREAWMMALMHFSSIMANGFPVS